MDRVQWRKPQVRFLRGAPRGTARRFDANGIQRTYRCYSSRTRTGSKLNRHRAGVILPQRKREELLQRRRGVLASRLRGSKSPRDGSECKPVGRADASIQLQSGAPQRQVSFDRFMFGVLKRIVSQIEHNFSTHFTRRQGSSPGLQ